MTDGGHSVAEPAFELDGLIKSFGTTRAVDTVDLAVPAGAFFGLVGPNGAGKTTSILMGCGLLRPDEGSARIFGADVWQDPVRAKSRVGLLPDGLAMPERLTGREYLTYLGLLRGMSEQTVGVRVEELLDVLDLERAETTLLIDYSTGMRKKVGLAAAMLHAPRLLVLDEPFEGVDPVSAATVRAILEQFVSRGGSVVFSSHVMVLVEQLCSHVGIIVDGRVAAADTLEEVAGGDGLETVFTTIAGHRSSERGGLSWLTS